ncbi:conserved hypothetical protein [Paraburkholderia tropica]
MSPVALDMNAVRASWRDASRLDRNHVAANLRGFASEHGDGFAGAIRHADVVDAVAAGHHLFDGFGGELVVGLHGAQEFDRAAGSDRVDVVRVAGEREGRIGQREDQAAVADLMAVEEFGPHGHAQTRVAGAYLEQFHAEGAAATVSLVHGLRGGAGQFVGRHVAGRVRGDRRGHINGPRSAVRVSR